ncbi:MAG: glucosyltransferase-S, partial [Nonlabens sp.]
SDEYYRDFIDEFSSESNVFLYVDTNKLSNASGKYLNRESRKELKQNEAFFSQFTQLGLELKAQENFFESKAVIHYDSDYDYEAIQLEERNKDVPLNLVTIKKEEISKETIFDIAPIFPDDFTANFHEQKFNNGHLKMKVYLKDGLPDGRYKEYYFDGQLKISGRYDDGKQDGTWRAYLRNGKLFHKKRF